MKNYFIKLCSIVVVAMGVVNINGTTTKRDSIVADFDEFVRIIEDTHPDPYTNYGGQILFHKKANDVRRELLIDPDINITDFYKKTSEFLSQMHDGHSFVNSPMDMENIAGRDSILVIKFMCGDDALIVNAIDSINADLIGSRLIGINGINIEQILDRVGASYPCENKYGRIGMLCNWFRPISFYRNILDDTITDIRMEFLTLSGEKLSYAPKVVHYNQFGEIAKARVAKDERFPSQQMEWKEMEGCMFFRLGSVMARENFEFQYYNNWDFYDQLAYQYRLLDKELPSDTLAAIKALPSMSETFLDMLNDMKAKNVKNLVIDLR